MKLIDIIDSKETVYFIPYFKTNKGEVEYFDKSIYTNPIRHREGLIRCNVVINKFDSNYCGLNEYMLLREKVPIFIVNIGFGFYSKLLKVVYTQNTNRILWKDDKWLI